MWLACAAALAFQHAVQLRLYWLGLLPVSVMWHLPEADLMYECETPAGATIPYGTMPHKDQLHEGQLHGYKHSRLAAEVSTNCNVVFALTELQVAPVKTVSRPIATGGCLYLTSSITFSLGQSCSFSLIMPSSVVCSFPFFPNVPSLSGTTCM